MARGRIEDDTPKGRISNLVMIWRYALRYKWTIAGAGIALLLAAAAIAGEALVDHPAEAVGDG